MIKRPIHSFEIKYNLLTNVLTSIGAVQNPETNELVKGTLVWDTGATRSSINANLINNLNLQTTGKKKVRTASNIELRDIKLVNIILPHNVIVRCEEAFSLNLEKTTLALIGMDIIGLGSFLVQNKNNKTIFQYSFPSLEKIDYINFINLSYEENAKNQKKLKKKDPKHPLLKQYATKKLKI